MLVEANFVFEDLDGDGFGVISAFIFSKFPVHKSHEQEELRRHLDFDGEFSDKLALASVATES